MTQPTVRSVVATALFNKVLEDTTLVTAISTSLYPTGQAFLMAAPDDAVLPYVRAEWVYGGEPANSPKREFDQLWIVCVTAFDQSEAIDLDALVREKLVGAELTFSNNWSSWTPITVMNEYEKLALVQGNNIWSIGAYYRIRGVKDA